MPILNSKIIIIVGLVLFSLTAMSQKTGKFTFGNKDSDKFRGFGIGYGFYSGHKELSKIFTFKRKPLDEYKIGAGLYITYFNLNENKKLHYYVDGGFVFWNEQKLDIETTPEQRSELIQFTGSYRIGKIRIVGRFGGLLNHNVINSDNIATKKNDFNLTTGIGLSIPILFKKTKGVSVTVLINRVNKHYTWSGTVFIPLVFHN
tara:strand:+ start:4049 stop:4657 length:609 start_codon:yes stop_codon:yes gene_type:complete